jgi:hypothetical protein
MLLWGILESEIFEIFGGIKMKLRTLVLVSLCAFASLETAEAKNTYLVIGRGNHASVYGFKSEAQCEKVRARYVAWANRTTAKLKRGVKLTFPNYFSPDGHIYIENHYARCKDTLPLGFVRPG